MNSENEQLKRVTESEAAWRKQQLDQERSDIAESKRIFDESEASAARQREETKKRSAADRTFTEACEFAKNSVRSDDLQGEIRPFCEVRYTVKQGLKATMHSREDGIATLVLQRAILVRLDFIKSLVWIAVLLLTYIAFRVS